MNWKREQNINIIKNHNFSESINIHCTLFFHVNAKQYHSRNAIVVLFAWVPVEVVFFHLL